MFIISYMKNRIRIFMFLLKLHTSVRVRSSSAAALPGCSPSPGSPSGPAAPPLHTRLQNKQQVWGYSVTWPHRWNKAPLKHERNILLQVSLILFAFYRLWCPIWFEPLLTFLHDGENAFHLSCFYSETSGSRCFLLSEMCCPLVADSYITS